MLTIAELEADPRPLSNVGVRIARLWSMRGAVYLSLDTPMSLS